MTVYEKSDFEAFEQRVRLLRRPLLMTHERPDGDAWGCLIAVRRALTDGGADPLAIAFDPPSAKYAWLVDCPPIRLFRTAGEASARSRSGGDSGEMAVSAGEADLESADGVLILDTCAYGQVRPMASWLRAARRRGLPIIALDHHVSRDVETDVLLVDESAGAACLIVFEWMKATGRNIDAEAAVALFTGIATDTGWFAHSNTDARILSAASELARLGAEAYRIHDRLYLSEPAGRVRLFAAAMDRMTLYHDDRVAVLHVTGEMFRRAGADPADTEDLAGQPLRIASVELSVLIVETGEEPPTLKLSFRAKGGTDVARVAGQFGGGGHPKAAGARINDEYRAALPRILSAVTQAVELSDRSA